MLKLRPISVFGNVKVHLETQQLLIDKLSTYEEKVQAAKTAWDNKSRKTFDEIRQVLDSICPGARRCHYCEDSAADEIEHVWPKNFYPEKTFSWRNYLFACGPCNGSNKRDQCAVFDNQGNILDIERKKGAPVIAPPKGDPLFIDPTSEDPTEYLSLDLETGLFVPIHSKGSREHYRAEYTLRVLGLNDRDYLSRARRHAYSAYKDALESYVALKKKGCTRKEQFSKHAEISEKHHPSVWHEIKVTAQLGIAHHMYFEQHPELYDL